MLLGVAHDTTLPGSLVKQIWRARFCARTLTQIEKITVLTRCFKVRRGYFNIFMSPPLPFLAKWWPHGRKVKKNLLYFYPCPSHRCRQKKYSLEVIRGYLGHFRGYFRRLIRGYIRGSFGSGSSGGRGKVEQRFIFGHSSAHPRRWP